MYDNFDMPRCIIVNETIHSNDDHDPDDDNNESSGTGTATVQFIAEMILRETGEKTSFMETSTFEKAPPPHGVWLYVDGTIEAAPGSQEVDGGRTSDDDDSSIEQKMARML
jgi:hypothetical protein